MSKLFDLLCGKTDGPVAEAEARAEYSEGWLGAILEENEELRTALKDVVTDVLDYERINNLAPNPGREFCWDSVGRAAKLLGIRR